MAGPALEKSGEAVPTAFGPTHAKACLHDAQGTEVSAALTLEEIQRLALPHAGKVRWLRIEGLGDRALLQGVAEAFHLHPLAMEDVLHLHQRPKLEAYDNGYFLVLPRFHFGRRLLTEQVCLFLGDDWIISFGVEPLKEFDHLEARLAVGRGHVREGSADRLLHHCIDAIVDAYVPELTAMDEAFAKLERRLQGRNPDSVVFGLRELRTDLFKAHTGLRALQGALMSLHADRDDWLDDAIQPYFKDLVDHVSHSLDHVENLREGVAEAQQLYQALLSQRINDVMRVLTVMSAIFMPLTFIAGIYGMNFAHMPELSWVWGYPVALLSMGLVAVGLVIYFARRGWLGSDTVRRQRGHLKDEDLEERE
jgi:magnesium transporter